MRNHGQFTQASQLGYNIRNYTIAQVVRQGLIF